MAKKHDFNQYYDAPVTAHVHAKVVNGQFVETTTGAPLVLKEGANVRMVVAVAYLPDALQEQYKLEERTILPAGSELVLSLPNTDFTFYVGLHDDLKLVSKNNKAAIVDGGTFEVHRGIERLFGHTIPGFEPFKEHSLNQVFFRISMKYRPSSRSHNANVYRHFREAKSGKLLDRFRF